MSWAIFPAGKKPVNPFRWRIVPALQLFCAVTVAAWAAPAGGGSDQDWQEWNSAIYGYMSQVKATQNKTNHLLQELSGGLKVAMKNSDRSLRDTLVSQINGMLTVSQEELNSLEPPADLLRYHRRVMDSYICRRLSNEALLRDDVKSSLELANQAVKMDIEALRELRRVGRRHGAPAEFIQSIHSSIEEYKKQLE